MARNFRYEERERERERERVRGFAKKYADVSSSSLQYTLIRPFGFSSVEAKPISNPDVVVMSSNHAGRDQFDLLTKKLNMSGIVDVGGGYGGPKTLSKYKAYIEFPYQVSTMKLYENIAHGVVSLIPSYSFFKDIVENTTVKTIQLRRHAVL